MRFSALNTARVNRPCFSFGRHTKVVHVPEQLCQDVFDCQLCQQKIVRLKITNEFCLTWKNE
jgi:hypothetical protein